MADKNSVKYIDLPNVKFSRRISIAAHVFVWPILRLSSATSATIFNTSTVRVSTVRGKSGSLNNVNLKHYIDPLSE